MEQITLTSRNHFTGGCHHSLSRWRRRYQKCRVFNRCLTSSVSCGRQILIGSVITPDATEKHLKSFTLWYAEIFHAFYKLLWLLNSYCTCSSHILMTTACLMLVISLLCEAEVVCTELDKMFFILSATAEL